MTYKVECLCNDKRTATAIRLVARLLDANVKIADMARKPMSLKPKGLNGHRAPRFSFTETGIRKAGIKKGAKITSTLNGETAVFEGDDPVKCIKFRGEKHSLSSAAMVIAKETGRAWPRIQGPVYWTYQGQKLNELRDLPAKGN